MKLQSIGLIQKIYYDQLKPEKINDLPVDPKDVDTLTPSCYLPCDLRLFTVVYRFDN